MGLSEKTDAQIYDKKEINDNFSDVDVFWFGRFEALRPSQQFFSRFGTFSWVEPILSNEDKASCSRTQHRTSGEIRTHDLAIKSAALYQLN